MLWTVGLGETSLSRCVKIHMSISRVGYCGTPCMWVCARATDRLTLISLLQNVQSGVDLNTYTFLCFLKVTVLQRLRSPNTKLASVTVKIYFPETCLAKPCSSVVLCSNFYCFGY